MAGAGIAGWTGRLTAGASGPADTAVVCQAPPAIAVAAAAGGAASASLASPPGSWPSSTTVEVTLNGGADWLPRAAGSAPVFAFTRPLAVRSMAPAVGPTVGGGVTTLAADVDPLVADSPVRSSGVLCRFGTEAAAATAAHRGGVDCGIPPAPAAAEVQVLELAVEVSDAWSLLRDAPPLSPADAADPDAVAEAVTEAAFAAAAARSASPALFRIRLSAPAVARCPRLNASALADLRGLSPDGVESLLGAALPGGGRTLAALIAVPVDERTGLLRRALLGAADNVAAATTAGAGTGVDAGSAASQGSASGLLADLSDAASALSSLGVSGATLERIEASARLLPDGSPCPSGAIAGEGDDASVWSPLAVNATAAQVAAAVASLPLFRGADAQAAAAPVDAARLPARHAAALAARPGPGDVQGRTSPSQSDRPPVLMPAPGAPSAPAVVASLFALPSDFSTALSAAQFTLRSALTRALGGTPAAADGTARAAGSLRLSALAVPEAVPLARTRAARGAASADEASDPTALAAALCDADPGLWVAQPATPEARSPSAVLLLAAASSPSAIGAVAAARRAADAAGHPTSVALADAVLHWGGRLFPPATALPLMRAVVAGRDAGTPAAAAAVAAGPPGGIRLVRRFAVTLRRPSTAVSDTALADWPLLDVSAAPGPLRAATVANASAVGAGLPASRVPPVGPGAAVPSWAGVDLSALGGPVRRVDASRVYEARPGVSASRGGPVAVEVSLNGGMDWEPGLPAAGGLVSPAAAAAWAGAALGASQGSATIGGDVASMQLAERACGWPGALLFPGGHAVSDSFTAPSGSELAVLRRSTAPALPVFRYHASLVVTDVRPGFAPVSGGTVFTVSLGAASVSPDQRARDGARAGSPHTDSSGLAGMHLGLRLAGVWPAPSAWRLLADGPTAAAGLAELGGLRPSGPASSGGPGASGTGFPLGAGLPNASRLALLPTYALAGALAASPSSPAVARALAALGIDQAAAAGTAAASTASASLADDVQALIGSARGASAWEPAAWPRGVRVVCVFSTAAGGTDDAGLGSARAAPRASLSRPLRVINSTHALCVAPPRRVPGPVAVRIALEAAPWTAGPVSASTDPSAPVPSTVLLSPEAATAAVVVFVDAPRLDSATPRIAVAGSANTTMVLRGARFLPTPHLACRFSPVGMPGANASATTGTGPGASGALVDGGYLTALPGSRSGAPAAYGLPVPETTALPLDEAAYLSLLLGLAGRLGTGRASAGSPYAGRPLDAGVFGPTSGVLVPAAWLSGGELACSAPPLPQGRFEITVTVDGQTFSGRAGTASGLGADADRTGRGLPVLVLPRPRVTWTSAVLADARSPGAAVTVHGEGFANVSSLSCAFGDLPVPAVFVNETAVRCTPPVPRAVAALGADGAHPTSTSPAGLADPVLQAVTRGSVVLGKGLSWAPLSEIRHRSPDPHTGSRLVFPEAAPHAYGLVLPVRVEVSVNGQDFTEDGRVFVYAPGPTVSTVSPRRAIVARGRALPLFVTGTRFMNTSRLACRVGDTVSRAVFIATTLVWCKAPPAAFAGGARPQQSAGGRALPARLALDDDRDTAVAAPGAFADPREALWLGRDVPASRTLLVEVSNDGASFSSDRVPFHHDGSCAPGRFCPDGDVSAPGKQPGNPFGGSATSLVPVIARAGAGARGPLPDDPSEWTVDQDEAAGRYGHACPRGTFCPASSTNFTLCPMGTYQPEQGRPDCLRCPVGYTCPHEGMHVPRICPSGFVCDVTGLERAEQPCPAGHFCLEGTVTTATTCGDPGLLSSDITLAPSHAQLMTSVRPGREPAGGPAASFAGSRSSACFDNSTTDFGLQHTASPARYWDELRSLPLPPDQPFTPLRGRFCLDNRCMRLGDEAEVSVSDAFFDYGSTDRRLRRPVPCPSGTYCHPGTGSEVLRMDNFSAPQACFGRGAQCPEGTTEPSGFGMAPPGFFSDTGEVRPCPPGTFCPREGTWDPLPCRPGTFNGQTGQSNCTHCPRGHICPGFGRVDPAKCPAGFVCSRDGMSAAASRCPAGFFCLSGTQTSDPFRNDTTLRPLACRPGTWCPSGVGSPEVVAGNFFHAQNCTAGFFCEAASVTPTGMGLCPAGFFCPEGTPVPIPTPQGTEAQAAGTVQPANCLPNTYAPTIQTVQCYPCPPGTSCEFEAMFEVQVCPPGTYRSVSADGNPVCQGCPAGTWSKQWELRDAGECTPCSPGIVCPVSTMISPCSRFDLPQPFTPTLSGDSIAQCLARNRGEGEGGTGEPSPLRKEFFFGVLDPTRPEFIDDLGRGPYFISSDEPTRGECFRNPQRFGSVVYQRMRDYFGSLYEIQTGRKHQGYGDPSQYNGFFDIGHRAINLPRTPDFFPPRNCSSGFFFHNATSGEDEWHRGNCEADIICDTNRRSEAEACAEGRVCPEGTGNLDSDSTRCPAGFACDAGTTPDDNLHAPLGRLQTMCPAGHSCSQGTGFLNRFQLQCAAGYFCPTGTADPIFGRMSNDALLRGLANDEVNPFEPIVHLEKYLPGNRLPVNISRHDQRCFNAITDGIDETTVLRDFNDSRGGLVPGPVNLADDINLQCARDHKWRLVVEGEQRGVCFCRPQYRIAHEVYRAWECTGEKTNVITLADELEGVTTAGRLRKCSFSADPKLDLSEPWTRSARWDPFLEEWFLDQAIKLPMPGSERRYFRVQCASDTTVRDCSLAGSAFDPWGTNVARRCPQFCSFMDVKRWADEEYASQATAKLSGAIDRMDPLIYDVKHAVDLLDTYTDLSRADSADDEGLRIGDRLPGIMQLHPTTGQPVRLDACECEELIRCPNGTTSAPRAESVDECRVDPASRDVLTRITPVDPSSEWLVETDRYQELSDPVTPLSGLGTVRLLAMETAVLTFDLRHLDLNFTYGLYRLSLYAGCKPCPPRFRCNRDVVPPTCPAVAIEEQQALGHLCADCCRCNRLALPGWLEEFDSSINDMVARNAFGTEPGQPFYPYADNKHRIWQVEVKALRAIEITPVFELLHGRYYREFRTQLEHVATLSVTRPDRAINYDAYNVASLVSLFTDQWDIVTSGYTRPASDPPVRDLPNPNELQGAQNVSALPESIDPALGTRVVNPTISTDGSTTPRRSLSVAERRVRALRAAFAGGDESGPAAEVAAKASRAAFGDATEALARANGLARAETLPPSRAERRARDLQTAADDGEQEDFIDFDLFDPTLYERRFAPWDHPTKKKRFSRGGFRPEDTFLGRADIFNAPGSPRGELLPPRFSFLAILQDDQFNVDDPDSLELPLNLPRSYKRIDAVSQSIIGPGLSLAGVQKAAAAAAALGQTAAVVPTFELGFENDVFLGVSVDYAAGDPAFAQRLRDDPTEGGPGQLPTLSYYDSFLVDIEPAPPTADQAAAVRTYVEVAETSTEGAAAIVNDPPTDGDVLRFLILELRASSGLGATPAVIGEIIAASRRITPALGAQGTGSLCDVYLPDMWGGPGNSSTPALAEEVRPASDVAIDSDTEYAASPLWFTNGDPLADDGRIRFLSLPYLPFVSNCEFGDSQVWLSRLTEQHGGCNLVSDGATRHVSPYPWEQLFDPVADGCLRFDDQVCPLVAAETSATVQPQEPGVFGNTAPDRPGRHGVQVRCYYEEAVLEPGLRTRWFEKGAGETVFYLTKDPLPARDFIGRPSDAIGWGRSAAIEAMLGTDEVLDVTVSGDFPGDASLVPRRVKLGLYYFQVNSLRKRLVLAELSYREMCTIADSQAELERLSRQEPPVYRCLDSGFEDKNYTLETEWVPLNYLALLNLFAFSADMFVVYFALLGAVVALFGVIVWIFARIMTRLPAVPPLNLCDLGGVVSRPSCAGVLIATVPFAMAVAFTWVWFFVIRSEKPLEEPQPLNLGTERAAWVDRSTITETDVMVNLRGRYATVLQLVGWFAFMAGVRLLVPDEMATDGLGDDVNEDETTFDAEVYEDKMYEGETVMTSAGGQAKHGTERRVDPETLWVPHLWKRSLVVLCAFAVIMLMEAVLEFSYSDLFADNQYESIVAFKLSNILLEQILVSVVRENLVVAPIMVLTSIVELLITLGASDFTDFVVAYLVELSLNILERVLLDPLIKTVMSSLPRWRLGCRRCCRRRRNLRTKAQRAAEDDEWRAALEHMARETEGAEPVIDAYLTYANGLTALLMSPFVQLYYLLTDTTGQRVTELPQLYGIRTQDLVFYTIFAALIVFFTLLMDLFLMNALELLHGWRIYDMLQYFSYRFSVREKRWQLFSRDFDPTVSGALQSTDLLSFSSQFYFLNAGVAYALFLILAGVNIHLRLGWALVWDPWFILLLVISYIFVRLAGWLCIRLAEWAQLWSLPGVRRLRNNVSFDKELARRQADAMKKAIEDAENKRIESKALRDEEFRHRWLKRNKPWVVAKIASILTPRQLAREGPDNKPMEEWVKSIYERLTGEGPEGDWSKPDRAGRQLPSARRSDISDLGSSDDEAQAYLRQPLPPLPGRSADMMRWWLGKARRRMLYTSTVADLIEAEQANFARSLEADKAARLTVVLARPADGEADPAAMDQYIAEYETLHPPEKEPPSAPFNSQRWRAFFRARAKYAVREKDLAEAADRARRLDEKAKRREAMGRLTRAGDVSDSDSLLSDESSEVEFDPVVVDREAPVGKVMAKWLDAARGRLTGMFPRPEAEDAVVAYVTKMRERQRRRALGLPTRAEERAAAKEAAAQAAAATGDGLADAMAKDTDPDAAKTAAGLGADRVAPVAAGLAQRWLTMARQRRIEGTRSELNTRLDRMGAILGPQISEATDWYYGADTRARGEELLREGKELKGRRQADEAEARSRGARMLAEADDHAVRMRSTMDTERSKLQRELDDKEARLTEEARQRAEVADTRLRSRALKARADAGLRGAPVPPWEPKSAAEYARLAAGDGSRAAAADADGGMDHALRLMPESALLDGVEGAAREELVGLLGASATARQLLGAVQADLREAAHGRTNELINKQGKRHGALATRRSRVEREAQGLLAAAAETARGREASWVRDSSDWLSSAEPRVERRVREQENELLREVEEDAARHRGKGRRG